MDAENPQKPSQVDLNSLTAELRSLRDLLVTLSLQLTDIQFESDSILRANVNMQASRLLRDCQSHIV